ncbi:MAG: hypothetical protein M3169_05905 [Candidatus Eremiobacteraeota bacterium]|nr:hypothetical protein [Candidatus Eremiobacteraeota bacterium]
MTNVTRRLVGIAGLTAVALAVSAATIGAENVAVGAAFRELPRLTTDFSPAFFSREIDSLAGHREARVFLGDSVLWGYRLRADEAAVTILARRGCDCTNLSFKAGSPANDYAVLRLLHVRGVRARAVVLEVNQKAFNVADPSYQTLHPAIADLAAPLLDAPDRALLDLRRPTPTWYDRALSERWLVYAMRTDIRETLFGEADAAPQPEPTAADFEGSYNLHPLDEKNVAVHFLEKTADVLRADGVRGVAFLTPTNHRLLHRYIDNAAYRANAAYLRTLLERRGVRVLDLDTAFAADDFFDNDHLKADAQGRLAAILGAALR